MQNLRYAVVGAANVDIGGTAKQSLTLHDSNIGCVRISAGGVGRNIAENLARLGQKVNFFSAFAGDAFSHFLQEELLALDIRFSDSYISQEKRSSTYLFVNDEKGEMQVAVNDMELIESVPQTYFEKIIPLINQNDVCVLDTNWSSAAFAFLMENIDIPIYVDPVSLKKAEKCLPYLANIHSFKPNLMEAQYLTKATSVEDIATVLLEQGVKKVFVSLGDKGIYYADTCTAGLVPTKQSTPINTTGAGDTAMATLAATHGLASRQQAMAAISASALCVMSSDTVAKNLNQAVVQKALAAL